MFKLDIEEDLKNIYNITNNKVYGNIPSILPKILEIAKDKKFEDCKEELREYNKKIYSSPHINIFINSVNKAWNKISEEYFNRLENITKKKFPYEELTANITTINTCPYDPIKKSFMISLYYSLLHALNAIGHELMHLHFHHYYFEDVKKQIGNTKTHDLKEALTILLNLEFKDLWFYEDKGYSAHKELRKFIEREWNKKKDFDKLLDKCVSYLITERRSN